MGLTRQEVNLRRLLAKCEFLIKTNRKEEKNFLKYIGSLEEMAEEVKKQNSTSDEYMLDYLKRIKNLKFHLGLLAPEDTDTLVENKTTAREQLLEVRKRNSAKPEGEQDLNNLIDHHQNMHEKIAQDMLMLTRNLKDQSSLANKIIKKDTEVVSRSTELTDKNFSKLKVESEKLTEHSKRAWKCWMWIMLLIVMVIFINMVMFMKVMKKKY